MAARDIRSSKKQGTKYLTFASYREHHTGYTPNTISPYIGESPTVRVFTQAFDFEDMDVAYKVHFKLPFAGRFTGKGALEIVKSFDGTGADDETVILGDVSDDNGLLTPTFAGEPLVLDVAIDLTAAAGTFYTFNGAYANLYKLLSAGHKFSLVCASAGDTTQGRGLLYLEVASYAEATDAEWNLT